MQYSIVKAEDGSRNITVFRPGDKPLVAADTHPNFEKIIEGAIKEDDSILDLFDIALAAGQKLQRLTERITARNGWLYMDGDRMENVLVDQVMNFLAEGVDDWKPIVKFLDNVAMNPSAESREQLYNWIEKDKLTLTDEGMIVGYKGVKRDTTHGYKSSSSGTAIVNGEVFTGQIPNPIGAIVEMPRSEVLDSPSQDCAVGLHVGTWQYASTFSERTLEVEVHPRDVVSVPNYDKNKMRVCRYKVVKELTKRYETPIKETNDKAGKVEKVSPKTEPKKGKGSGLKSAVKKVLKNDRKVQVGDVYEDRDKRRAGRKVRVTAVSGSDATVVPYPDYAGSKATKIATNRLQSRAYKLSRAGKPTS